MLDDRLDEHRNVAGPAPTDIPLNAGAAPHPFPCPLVQHRTLGAEALRQGTHRRGGLREMRAETLRLPDLKLVTEPDERDCVGYPGMGLQLVGQHHPALAVDLDGFAAAVERHLK